MTRHLQQVAEHVAAEATGLRRHHGIGRALTQFVEPKWRLRGAVLHIQKLEKCSVVSHDAAQAVRQQMQGQRHFRSGQWRRYHHNVSAVVREDLRQIDPGDAFVPADQAFDVWPHIHRQQAPARGAACGELRGKGGIGRCNGQACERTGGDVGAQAFGIVFEQLRHCSQDRGVDADELADVVACRHADAEVEALEVGGDVRRYRGPRAFGTRFQQRLAVEFVRQIHLTETDVRHAAGEHRRVAQRIPLEVDGEVATCHQPRVGAHRALEICQVERIERFRKISARQRQHFGLAGGAAAAGNETEDIAGKQHVALASDNAVDIGAQVFVAA